MAGRERTAVGRVMRAVCAGGAVRVARAGAVVGAEVRGVAVDVAGVMVGLGMTMCLNCRSAVARLVSELMMARLKTGHDNGEQ